MTSNISSIIHDSNPSIVLLLYDLVMGANGDGTGPGMTGFNVGGDELFVESSCGGTACTVLQMASSGLTQTNTCTGKITGDNPLNNLHHMGTTISIEESFFGSGNLAFCDCNQISDVTLAFGFA